MRKIDIKEDYSERVKYDHPEYPVYIRRELLSDFPNYAAESHWHEDIELIVALSGDMRYNVNGEIVTLHEGEGIIVNARQLHHGFSEGKTECDFICILFHPILMCLTKGSDGDHARQILESGIAYFHLSPKVDWQSRVIGHIRDIGERMNEATPLLYTHGRLCLLWSELLCGRESMSHSKPGKSKLATLKSMIGFIHEHYREKITLGDIAKAGYVSKRSCGTLFLEYQNKTPIEFLTDYRLRKSIELMNDSELTILDVALSVGFSGASYFAETFRKSFGVSPTEYRKQKETER